MFLGEKFEIQIQTINGWPDLTRVKNFDPDPSLAYTLSATTTPKCKLYLSGSR